MSNPITTDVTSTAMGLSWRHVVGVDFYEISFSPPINDDASAIIIKVFCSSSHEKTRNSHSQYMNYMFSVKLDVRFWTCGGHGVSLDFLW